MVWQRILTAPDSSTLEIRHGTNRLGYSRWRADVGQEITTGSRVVDFDDPIEGMVQHLSYYELDVDGDVRVGDLPQRARFTFILKLDTNRLWRTFSLTVTMRPDIYELRGDATEQTLHLHVDAGADHIDRTFRFAELRNPQQLLTELGGPALPLVLGVLGPRVIGAGSSTNLMQALGIHWEAHNDALVLGHNNVRAYKLKGTFLDRYHANMYISPVGEILRVELPNKIVLVNDFLSPARATP